MNVEIENLKCKKSRGRIKLKHTKGKLRGKKVVRNVSSNINKSSNYLTLI